MVRRQTVISEMTGHQNNLACAGVVGLQMFFFFYLLFSNIFQIKEYILLLRPKKGKVIYKRLWTLASRCLRGISVSRPSQLRQPHPLLHSSPQSKIQMQRSIHSHTRLGSEHPPPPHLWGAAKLYVYEAFPSLLWLSAHNSSALPALCQRVPLSATQDCNHSLKM